jgi:hypothetical protein
VNKLVKSLFNFDFSGSQIIVCDHEEDYAEIESASPPPGGRVFREWSHTETAENENTVYDDRPRAKTA